MPTARPPVRHAPVDAATLDLHLPGWDGADAYVVLGPPPADATAAARALFAPTATARRVLGLRDRLVRPLGLRPGAGTGEALFPVLARGADRVVLGLDDRHLDFRVVVDVEPGAVRCTTGLRRRPLGRASFAVVGPFHRRIVPAVLARAARSGWASRG